MEESREEQEPIKAFEPGFELPNLHFVRASHKRPSGWRLTLVRSSQSLKNLRIPWTAILSLAVVVVVATTFLALT